MKVTKHYENGRIYVYVEDGNARDCISFSSETQIRRLGECLTDLARIGGSTVEIKE